MCSNYVAVTSLDRLLSFFGVAPSGDMDLPDEVYPLRLAPFIRLAEDGSGAKLIEAGQYGLLPHFAGELQYGRKTYNARCETVATLASFRESWARSRRCVIPAEALFEPKYIDGLVERWRIQQPGGVPMGVAGIYRRHDTLKDRDGRPLWTFAMLTCNCDTHPFYSQFHAPGEEKRMPVILDSAEYERWLRCTPEEARAMCLPWQGPLEAWDAPRAPRAPKPAAPPKQPKQPKPPKIAKTPKVPPAPEPEPDPEPPPQLDLF
jgi:putative SOS response-associated peptidase YedK